MAELALASASPVIKMVVKKLASGLWKELGLARSVSTDIEKLQSKLSKIQDVLDDVERKPISKPLQDTLRMLRDVARDAEDVVEDFETEVLRRRMEGHDHMTGKVRDFFSSNNPIAFRSKMAGKIKEIRDRIDDIVKDNKDFDSMVKSGSDSIKKKSDSYGPGGRETTSFEVEPKIYGRDEDAKKVMEFLVDRDNDKNISILPIVGLGGVGKTTLARSVYNNEIINEQFKLRMWVCVGENFDVNMILRAMIEQVTKKKCDLSTLEAMLSVLKEELRRKIFLLILDDLWNENAREWDNIKPLFVCAELGSKIIVTTRSEGVASITGTTSPYKLEGLGFDDCWALFGQKAFGLGRQEETPMLVDIGKKIVEKCGGSPLAAKLLGSLMGSITGEAAWSAISDSELWRLPIHDIGILPVLKLSYDHLPSHLKRCFLYCSMFPKDRVFAIERLIQLWMAEGLIDTSRTCQNVEDIGKQYFNHLLWRSFFQDVEMDEYNNPVSCKMHDLVHDLACSLTEDESLVMEGGTKSISHGCRYLSVISYEESSTALKTIYEAKKLRSLLLLEVEHYDIADIVEFLFNVTKNFIQLHALDLGGSIIQNLSNRISRLRHLRFLDLSWTHITILPTSITRLYNLQTLNLESCGMLKELPQGIGNLCNLRYMDISFCSEITTLPTSITGLSSLQTLNLQHCDMLKELPQGIGNLCNLRYMDISFCSEITTLPTSITGLSSLQTLNLQHCDMLKELPEGTGNLCNLRYMDISFCSEITTLPTSITGLSSLQTLNLQHCDMLKELPQGIGNLCNLRHMDISFCSEITTLPTSITGLSSLQTLNLQDCDMLKELPQGIGNLCNLRHLDIRGCDSLSCMPRGLGQLSNLETLPMFIVAEENGRTIVELQHLNSIRGELKIINLHHVKDPDEAMQANLGAKTRLNYLSLEWNEGVDEEREPSSTEVEVAADVLEKLQPHRNLRELDIIDYIGTRLPNWMSPSFPNLVELTMRDLKRCEHVPLGQWPSLKHLILDNMHAVRRIGEEFCGDGDGITFPSLELLILSNMPNLEIWHTESATTGSKMASFPCLTELRIESCPKLAVQPCIPCSVETLRIIRSNEMLLSAGSLAGLSKLKFLYIRSCGISSSSSSSSSSGWWDGLQYLTALDDLRIWECDELTCLPEDILYLPSLRTLELVSNRNIRSLEGGGRRQEQPAPFFTTLRYLKIYGANALTALPEWVGGLTSLQNLEIMGCPNLAMLPDNLQHLTALQKLYISDLPQLTMLPDSLQHLTALQELHISNLPQLTMLPDSLQHLTALQKLYISYLPQLTMLADSLQHLTALQTLYISNLPQLAMLPNGLQHLTALQYLTIQGCPQLARRCKRETGEDWHKIAHIPDIYIEPEEENREEMNKRCTFAMKFLDQFGFARCAGHS